MIIKHMYKWFMILIVLVLRGYRKKFHRMALCKIGGGCEIL